MISVVLPVYNGEKYLRESIDSILNQTYKEFELIVVNDCSTDSTKQIVEDYMMKDSRVKIVNNTTNQKLPKSLNIGFDSCSGDYYTWTSDDNVFLPDAFEKLVRCLENGKADLVFSMCEVIDDYGKVIDRTERYEDLDELYYKNIVLACFMYKREVHETLGGYDVNKFLVEDYDFWLRAYRRYKFLFIPEWLYQVRFHKNNLGHTRREDVNIRKIELLKENLNYNLREEIKTRIIREISSCYMNLSNIYYEKLSGEKSERQNMKKIYIKNAIKSLLK